MQKSSLAQLRLADDLLLTTVWQVMTILQNTAPDPTQTVQPSSRAPKPRARQHYNKHMWLHVSVNLQSTNNKYNICFSAFIAAVFRLWSYRNEQMQDGGSMFHSNTGIYLQSTSWETAATVTTIMLNICNIPFTGSEIYSQKIYLK